MSREEGGLCSDDVGADICASIPVLTIGACNSVEIAISLYQHLLVYYLH